MDFVERCLSLSPDGGSGSFEASVILAVVVVICVFVFRRMFQTGWNKRIEIVASPK